MNLRVFVAVPVSESLRYEIGRQMRRWREALPARPMRWVPPQCLHLTLRFFGDVPSAQIETLAQSVERAVGNVPTLHLAVERLGAFPSLRNPRVLWLGVNGQIEALRHLHLRIESHTVGLGRPPEARAFDAHLTVARVKDATAHERALISEFCAAASTGPLGSWHVDRVELIQSELSPTGSRYTCLKSIPLNQN